MIEVSQNLYESLLRFKSILSEDDILRLLAIQDQPLSTGIRLNPLKTTPEKAIHDLSRRYGWEVHPIPFCETGWNLTNTSGNSPGVTIEHRLGQYYIQDAASMLPVSLFAFKENAPLILDMAASPGGKSTHLIDRSQDRGFLIANDSSQGRIPALRSVLSTWGGSNLAVTSFPGEAIGEWYPETFDIVLLDAPCSMENLRPAPNHPMRQTTEDERLRLQERQIQLLTSGLQTLKIGGQLVYATCSLAPEEDEAVIDALLQAHPHAVQIEDVSDHFTLSAPGLTRFNQHEYHPQIKHALRLWPHRTGMSGFFCALITKHNPIPTTRKSPPSREFNKTGLETVDKKIKSSVFNHISEYYGFDFSKIMGDLSLELYRRLGQFFLIPARYLQHFITLPYEYIGMPLGRLVEEELEPSHEFISRFGRYFTKGIIQIRDSHVEKWVDGRDIRHPEINLSPAGQYLLVKDQAGRNLGMGKLLPKRLRNMLPRRSV